MSELLSVINKQKKNISCNGSPCRDLKFKNERIQSGDRNYRVICWNGYFSFVITGFCTLECQLLRVLHGDPWELTFFFAYYSGCQNL